MPPKVVKISSSRPKFFVKAIKQWHKYWQKHSSWILQ